MTPTFEQLTEMSHRLSHLHGLHVVNEHIYHVNSYVGTVSDDRIGQAAASDLRDLFALAPLLLSQYVELQLEVAELREQLANRPVYMPQFD